MNSIQSSGIAGNISLRQTISGAIQVGVRNTNGVISKTTAEWNSEPRLVSQKDIIYVYTDYSISPTGTDIPNIKIGDGRAYVIDLPFIASGGITPEQIEFWNNKVSVDIDTEDPENIIFYTDWRI